MIILIHVIFMFYFILFFIILFYFTVCVVVQKMLRQECDYDSLLTMWSQQFSLKKFGLSLIWFRLIQLFWYVSLQFIL